MLPRLFSCSVTIGIVLFVSVLERGSMIGTKPAGQCLLLLLLLLDMQKLRAKLWCRTPHAARRTPHTAHRTPHTEQRELDGHGRCGGIHLLLACMQKHTNAQMHMRLPTQAPMHNGKAHTPGAACTQTQAPPHWACLCRDGLAVVVWQRARDGLWPWLCKIVWRVAFSSVQ